MRGVSDKKIVTRGYGDQEEYIAVVLTNIYMSEKGQRVFAGSHGSKILQGLDLEFFLDNSQHVNLSPMQLLDNFRWSQPAFYKALADLPPERPKYNGCGCIATGGSTSRHFKCLSAGPLSGARGPGEVGEALASTRLPPLNNANGSVAVEKPDDDHAQPHDRADPR